MVFWKRPAPVSDTFEASSTPKSVTTGYNDPEIQRIASAVSSGTTIVGRLHFDADARFEGSLDGDLSSSATLVIGPTTVINGPVNARTVIVFGTVNGNVRASGSVELRPGARVAGDVITRNLSLRDGAVLDGDVSMPIARVLPLVSAKAIRRNPTRPAFQRQETESAAQEQMPFALTA